MTGQRFHRKKKKTFSKMLTLLELSIKFKNNGNIDLKR